MGGSCRKGFLKEPPRCCGAPWGFQHRGGDPVALWHLSLAQTKVCGILKKPSSTPDINRLSTKTMAMRFLPSTEGFPERWLISTDLALA